jgi:hypothetical protein
MDLKHPMPSNTVVDELLSQLQTWRANLPTPLHWSEDERLQFLCTRLRSNAYFTEQFTTSSRHQVLYAYHADVVAAQLRSRYYYCVFLLHQPFLYKALHLPEQTTELDTQRCALCLKSCMLWPVAMSPVKDKKRLIPNNYVWTQSFIIVLLIFASIRQSGLLQTICEENIGSDEMQGSIDGMLEWLRDMQQMDAIADWGWNLLEKLYDG